MPAFLLQSVTPWLLLLHPTRSAPETEGGLDDWNRQQPTLPASRCVTFSDCGEPDRSEKCGLGTKVRVTKQLLVCRPLRSISRFCSLTAEITGEDLLCSKYFLSGAAVDRQLPPLRFMTVKGVDVLSRFYVHVAKWIKVWTVMFCSLQSSKAPQIKAADEKRNNMFFSFGLMQHTITP